MMEITESTTTHDTDQLESSITCMDSGNKVTMNDAADKWVERLIGAGKWRIRESWLPLFERPDYPDWLHLDRDSRASLSRKASKLSRKSCTNGSRLDGSSPAFAVGGPS